jgi:glycyl-tRNA synthetase
MIDKNTPEFMNTIVSLSKRRGFVFQSSEVYGGLNSCWDYGPLGVELKRNVKNEWWRAMVTSRRDIVGIDAAILMHPKVWEASGHLAGFTDPLVDCLLTKKRFRADHIPSQSGTAHYFAGAKDAATGKESIEPYGVLVKEGDKPQKARNVARDFYISRGMKDPQLAGETEEKVVDSRGFNPENGGMLTKPRNFNLMFKTFMGPVEDEASVVYMRPETAQGIFVNFLNVQQAARLKPPFGIAQVGKSFRNEITPGNFTYRTREFEQMEMEFFTPPDQDQKWYEYWKQERFDWYARLGIKKENLRLRDHEKNELAHYAKACVDVEYRFPFGWSELEGIANRADYDLKQHSQASGRSLALFDEETKQHLFPYVIEPAAGADRATLAFLVDAYDVDGEGDDARTVLRFHPALAPVKAAVLPLVKRDNMPEKAEKIFHDLIDHSINAQMDINASIGRRYARQDEAGTPYCITIDGQTLQDDTVTIRERDSREQYRVASAQIVELISEKLRKAGR